MAFIRKCSILAALLLMSFAVALCFPSFASASPVATSTDQVVRFILVGTLFSAQPFTGTFEIDTVTDTVVGPWSFPQFPSGPFSEGMSGPGGHTNVTSEIFGTTYIYIFPGGESPCIPRSHCIDQLFITLAFDGAPWDGGVFLPADSKALTDGGGAFGDISGFVYVSTPEPPTICLLGLGLGSLLLLKTDAAHWLGLVA